MFKSMNIKDYMILNPVCVQTDTKLFVAIDIILKNKISGLIVTDKNKHPVGMLSELDCLRAIIHGSYYQEVGGLVKEFMSTPCETISPNDDIMSVAKSMLDKKRRRRPVVDEDGKVVGQVTCRQILNEIRGWTPKAK